MITQERFDAAYQRIVEMREQASIDRGHLYRRGDKLEWIEKYNRAYGREQAFSQALGILEDAGVIVAENVEPTISSEYGLCDHCGGSIGLATGDIVELTFDQEPFVSGREEAPGGETLTNGCDISIIAHVCTRCFAVRDVTTELH